jgi:hypothetical protein
VHEQGPGPIGNPGRMPVSRDDERPAREIFWVEVRLYDQQSAGTQSLHDLPVIGSGALGIRRIG